MRIDLRAAQLLCSKLCHDLVGPVGAVNAGIELLEESAAGPMGADGAGGAIDLVGRSAGQVSRRLAFFRSAFGLGGGAGGHMGLDEVRELTAGFLADGNVELDWPTDPAVDGGQQPGDHGKLLLTLVLLGAECLPRGGRLAVRLADLPEGLGVALTATGAGARFKDDVAAVMTVEPAADRLSARNVHGHLAACLAEMLGTTIEVLADGEDEVRLAALLPEPERA